MFKKILLCTHGSEGARKAEALVFEKLLADNPSTDIVVLTIIDKDWANMSSDDWLNTSKARNQFKDYVQEQLTSETKEDWDRIKDNYPKASGSKFMTVVGGIEETILEVAEKTKRDLIVIGPYTKKPSRLTTLIMEKGLANRISVRKLQPDLPCPLLIAP